MDREHCVSNLTKVLLEEELGYEEVTIRIVPLSRVFEDVENGDLEAFQDVWLPNPQAQIDEVQDDIVQLDPWYQGETEFGVAVPYYMDVTSIDQLNQTGAELMFGIEPESVIMEVIPEEVIPGTASSKSWWSRAPRGCSQRSITAITMGRSSSLSLGLLTG